MGPQGIYRDDQCALRPRMTNSVAKSIWRFIATRVVTESTTMVRLARGRGECSVRRPFGRGCFPRSQACLWAGRSMTRQSPHVRE